MRGILTITIMDMGLTASRRRYYHDDTATSVFLAGDFNNWARTGIPLSKDEKGLWLAEVEAPSPGRYQYRFIVDGERWVEDSNNNGTKVPDNLGGLNSVISIE